MGLKEDTDRALAERAKAGAKNAAQTRGAEVAADTGAAKLPFVEKKEGLDVTKGQQGTQFEPGAQSSRELNNFLGLENVKQYRMSLPMLVTGLETPNTRAGDSDLIMTAAKIQDPIGSVREGDEERLKRIESVLGTISQKVKSDWLNNGGTLTDDSRNDIRSFLLNRVKNYRKGYDVDKGTFTDRAQRASERGGVKFAPEEFVGRDPLVEFQPALDAYAKTEATRKRIIAQRKKESGTVGLNDGAPKGTQIGGEPVKGWRLSPTSEAQAFNYLQETGDAAGYAKIVADKALEEGHIQPDEHEGVASATAAGAQSFIKDHGKTPEDRKKMVPGLDYSQIDKKARDDLTLPGAIAHGATNIPESAAQLVRSTGDLVLDAGLSVREGKPVGTTKSMYDLGKGVLQGGDENTDAALEGLKERYGGWSNLKNTLATDPVGLGLDAAGGVGLATKIPGLARTIGRGATAVTSRIPQGLRNFGNQVADVTAAGGRMAAAAPGGLIRGASGLLTGVPGEATRRMGAVGRARGRSGVSTPGYEATVGDLRGRGDPSEIIQSARDAVAEMRRQASAQYRSGMVDVTNDATILDFAPIDQRLLDLRQSAYHNGTVKNPQAADVLQRATDIVEEWRAADPATHHTPEGFDAMKQRLGGLVDEYGDSGNRAAARIAKGVYQDVRRAVADQVPSYARTMRDYERAADLTRQLEKTFSLGDNAAVDTTLRKLQSITRNNANTSYGYRANLGELMERYGGTDLLNRLSAQALSSPRPRGLMGAVGGGMTALGLPAAGAGAIFGGTAGAVPGLAMLAGAPLTIPRVAGEVALGVGRAAGEAERLGRIAINSPAGRAVTAIPRNFPVASMVGVQGASAIEGLGPNEEGPDLTIPPVAMTPEEEELERAARRVAGPPQFAYGGAVRRLSHRYNCGGRVRRA